MKFASLATFAFVACSTFVKAAPVEVEAATGTVLFTRRELDALQESEVQNMLRDLMEGSTPDDLEKRFTLSSSQKALLKTLYNYIKSYVTSYISSLETSSSKRDLSNVDAEKIHNVMRELMEGGDLEELHKRFTLSSTEKEIISEIWSYLKSFIISYIKKKLGLTSSSTTTTSTSTAAAKRDTVDVEQLDIIARDLMTGASAEEVSKRFSLSSAQSEVMSEIISNLKSYATDFIDEQLASSKKREEVDMNKIQLAVREMLTGASPDELHKRFTLSSTEKEILSTIWSYIKSFIVSYIEKLSSSTS